MVDQNKIAGNDNSKARRSFYQGADELGELSRLIYHIPKAKKLIKKYAKHSWKHTPENSSYAFLEYQLCTILERPTQSLVQRTFQLNDMAWVLEVSPLELVNDQSLFSNSTGLARFP